MAGQATDVAGFQEMAVTIRWISAGTTALVTLIVLLGAIWIIRYFNKSLMIPQLMLNELVQGNTKIETSVVYSELSPIVNAIVQLSSNIQGSSQFAENIGDGNFEYDFKPAGKYDLLGNSLVEMREKLQSIAESDKIRNWTTTGLAMFADLIRKGGDQKTLSDTLISQLVKYTHSNQGGLYALNHENGQDAYIELTACYAYDRKKYSDKRIEVGSGMLGQCVLEGSSINLKQVPDNYVSITSGLGMSNPTSVLIVPLKLNDVVEGVVELASFSHYQQHEIEFVERIGEMIASAIATVRVTDRTKKMLEESQQQSEEMRAQEEEMRQNMEEMQATQEAMQRQANELRRMQENLEVEKSMFSALMDALPDRITYKDTESRITRINKAKAMRLNMDPNEVIGKTDYDFFAPEHAEKAMREEKALVESGHPLLDIEELLTFNNGETAWVSSSRIPFKNEHHVMTGMFIISKDITKLKHAEIQAVQKTGMLKMLFNEFPLIQFSVDKDNHIQNVVAGEVRNADSLSNILKGKIIHEVLPNLSKTLRTETAEASAVLDTLPDGRVLKQFIFEDKVYIDHYVIVAIVE
jgi:PAS domain S-box-containing protein